MNNTKVFMHFHFSDEKKELSFGESAPPCTQGYDETLTQIPFVVGGRNDGQQWCEERVVTRAETTVSVPLCAT